MNKERIKDMEEILKPKPFYVYSVHEQLDLLHQEKISFSKLVENLNQIAHDFYKDKITEKGIIVPYNKSTIRQKLLHLEVGESIYTEDEHYRNRTKCEGNRIRINTAKKFSTLKNGNGWRTWRIS